jgi:hypothetical protein
MVSAPPMVLKPTTSQVEVPGDISSERMSEMAQAYILDGSDTLSSADLYLASRAFQNRMEEASKLGLTPRDVVLSLLRPALAAGGHCRCPSCQSRCTVCRQAVNRDFEKVLQ